MVGNLPVEVRASIADFIFNAGNIPNLRLAVLFGSTIDGTFNKKSDIDIALFFDTDHNPEVGEELKIAQKIAGDICNKNNLSYSFAFVCINIRNIEQNEVDFLQKINQTGIIIWQKQNLLIGGSIKKFLLPYMLVLYSFKELSVSNRSRLYRFLNGYTISTVKKGEQYVSKKSGILGNIGTPLSRGVFIIPQKDFPVVEETFKKIGVLYHTILVYSEDIYPEKGEIG